MLENKFQSNLIKTIKERFEGCEVLKNDPQYIQGIPDLVIIYRDKWAMLECKKNKCSGRQPNQDYYIKRFNDMSFASFINPGNKEEVLNEMERILKS